MLTTNCVDAGRATRGSSPDPIPKSGRATRTMTPEEWARADGLDLEDAARLLVDELTRALRSSRGRQQGFRCKRPLPPLDVQDPLDHEEIAGLTAWQALRDLAAELDAGRFESRSAHFEGAWREFCWRRLGRTIERYKREDRPKPPSHDVARRLTVSTVPDVAEAVVLAESMRQWVLDLPPPEREVLCLWLAGARQQEIASLVGVSQPTVSRRLTAALTGCPLRE